MNLTMQDKRIRFAIAALACLLLPTTRVARAAEADAPSLIIVLGAAGEPEYGDLFAQWAGKWEQTAKQAGVRTVLVGKGEAGDKTDRQRLEEALAAEPRTGLGELWLVLIGHGTYDGKTARFNLRGPDFSAEELNGWLKPIERSTAILNTASSSGPFVPQLSGPRRVVIAATKSGQEVNFARFGGYLAEAIGAAGSDIDKDGQTSLLEAWLSAARATADFYKQDGRLATEHSLLDDNGDQKGTPAEWFQGVRATKQPAGGAAADGARAQQFCLAPSARERSLPPELRTRRNELELAIVALRQRKSQLSEDDYYAALEPLLVELAELYARAEAGAKKGAKGE